MTNEKAASKPAAHQDSRYIVIGYGESDYPQASFANDQDELLDAVLGMIYTRPSDACDDTREEYRRDLADEDEWCGSVWRTEFEIGGIVVYDTGSSASPAAPAQSAEPEQSDISDKEEVAYFKRWENEAPQPSPTAVVLDDDMASDDSYVTLSVKGLQDLDTALDRADGKGYLPDDIRSAWECLDWRAASPQPVEQTRALTDEQIEDLQEAREILENMVRSVELDGNYSTEATCTFLRQALQCLPVARPASGETE